MQRPGGSLIRPTLRAPSSREAKSGRWCHACKSTSTSTSTSPSTTPPPPHVGRLTRAPPKNAQRQVQSSAADLWTRGPTGRRALRSALGALPFSLSSGPKLPPALVDEVSCSLPCPALPGLCLAERTPAARGDWQGHSLALGRSRRNDGTGGVLDERDGLLVRRAHSVSAGPQVRPGPARPLVPGTALNRQRDHLRYRY